MSRPTVSKSAPPGPGAEPAAGSRRWRPKRVLVTRSAYERAHGRTIVARCEAAGVTNIELLTGDRLPPIGGDTPRARYAAAKSTLAVVVAPPSTMKLQPIPPSADWRVDLAEGCPAHCQYCYLAGSLTGPPVTRVYANLDDILANLDRYLGHGAVTSGTAARGAEGTTFEASCYTDPLGIEAVTGSLSAAITYFGQHRWSGPVQLRATTKFDDVDPLLQLPHRGRTRIRLSVNAAAVTGRFEGGTASMLRRVAALGKLARSGYPIGLTIAPIMPIVDWRSGYDGLLCSVAEELAGVPDLDLTVELITHRFTPRSKQVLLDWYPSTQLEMSEDLRRQKRGKFGTVKHVYPVPVMNELKLWFAAAVPARLPTARVLYFT
ncbi:MAG: spore photoproduct lyase family protein [Nakamurella sp.]